MPRRRPTPDWRSVPARTAPSAGSAEPSRSGVRRAGAGRRTGQPRPRRRMARRWLPLRRASRWWGPRGRGRTRREPRAVRSPTHRRFRPVALQRDAEQLLQLADRLGGAEVTHPHHADVDRTPDVGPEVVDEHALPRLETEESGGVEVDRRLRLAHPDLAGDDDDVERALPLLPGVV